MRSHRIALLIAAAALLLAGGVKGTRWIAQTTEARDSSDMGGTVWGANYFPNVPLITHEGESVRFFDDLVKDKVVAINFIYTTCPDACPMETARLLEVQKLLGERMGKDVHFYSITIDPERDSAEVLNTYVTNWKVGPGWTFLTGAEEDIILLRRKLGVYIEEIQSEDSNDHNLSLVIGNQSSGRWMKRSPYENPYVLANQLGSWLHNWKLPSKADRNYADAPKLRNVTKGEDLFRTRCASCHTVGQGDVHVAGTRNIGPDLLNVTRQRDREWLTRWLIEPDKMLEEKDPLAMALLAQYNNVPMPNLRLTDYEAGLLLTYIEEESSRFEKRLEANHHGADHDSHAGHSAGGADEDCRLAEKDAGGSDPHHH